MPHRELDISAVPGRFPLNWPMGLTMLRLLLLPLFLWLMVQGVHDEAITNQFRPYRWAAVGVFALMAITDKLDGYLARKLAQTSKIGTILDPVADKLLIACSIILLSFDWLAPAGFAIPIAVVIAVYGKDLIVATGTLALLYTIGRVSIVPRYLGKVSTFLQLMLVLATLLTPDLSHWNGPATRELIATLCWLVILFAAASCLDYVLRGIGQYRAARPKSV